MLNNPTQTEKRKAAYAKGLWAEKCCRIYLRLQGYRILASRFKTPYGEIDIIARRGKHLHFIEVKAHATEEKSLAAISETQRMRIVQTGEIYRMHNESVKDCHVHGDVMLLAKGWWPRYIRDVLTG